MPISHLITLRNLYTVQLVHVSMSPMDPVFKQARVAELQTAITILDNQIANQQRGA